MKCSKIRYLGAAFVLTIVFVLIYYCPHNETYTKVIKKASCFEFGMREVVCKKCDSILESNILEKTNHEFGDYELVILPSVSGPGTEVRTCSVCSKKEEREYYCKHEETYIEITKEATCSEYGETKTICGMCGVVVANEVLEKTETHSFGKYKLTVKPTESAPGIESRICSVCSKEERREYICKHETLSKEGWIYIKYATPFENGERYKKCSLCGTKVTDVYMMAEMPNNSVYITGTDINHSFTISSFTQSAADKYNIVYTEESHLGANNPFILGHNNRALGILYQTKVGAHIYLHINGVIEVYEVVISEYGLGDSENTDITGQTTGTSIWQQYGSKTLHIYTCYGDNERGRWIVLGKKIS